MSSTDGNESNSNYEEHEKGVDIYNLSNASKRQIYLCFKEINNNEFKYGGSSEKLNEANNNTYKKYNLLLEKEKCYKGMEYLKNKINNSKKNQTGMAYYEQIKAEESDRPDFIKFINIKISMNPAKDSYYLKKKAQNHSQYSLINQCNSQPQMIQGNTQSQFILSNLQHTTPSMPPPAQNQTSIISNQNYSNNFQNCQTFLTPQTQQSNSFSSSIPAQGQSFIDRDCGNHTQNQHFFHLQSNFPHINRTQSDPSLGSSSMRQNQNAFQPNPINYFQQQIQFYNFNSNNMPIAQNSSQLLPQNLNVFQNGQKQKKTQKKAKNQQNETNKQHENQQNLRPNLTNDNVQGQIKNQQQSKSFKILNINSNDENSSIYSYESSPLQSSSESQTTNESMDDDDSSQLIQNTNYFQLAFQTTSINETEEIESAFIQIEQLDSGDVTRQTSYNYSIQNHPQQIVRPQSPYNEIRLNIKINEENESKTEKEEKIDEVEPNKKEEEDKEEENFDDDGSEIIEMFKGERKEKMKGKKIGKPFYFPNVCVYSDDEDLKDVSNLKSSANAAKDLIKKLPKVGSDAYIELKDFYDDLNNCIDCIKESFKFYQDCNVDSNGPFVYNENLFNFQTKAAECFTSILHQKPNPKDRICPYGMDFDMNDKRIYVRSKKTLVSYMDVLYGTKRTPSRGKTSVYISSADLKTENGKNVSEFSINSNEKDVTEHEKGGETVAVNAFISNISMTKYHKKNEKLTSFYQGKYNKETQRSYELSDIESSVIISYCSKTKKIKDKLICEFAYVKFDAFENSHVLCLRNISVDTGFYHPVTAMYFHHDDEANTNKLYLCGDIRVKEFTIEGLDCINDPSMQDELSIISTNTFYFGEDNYINSVITVWENELILACNYEDGINVLYIWDTDDEIMPENDEIKSNQIYKNEIEKLKDFGIDENEFLEFKNIGIDITELEKLIKLDLDLNKIDKTIGKSCNCQINLPKQLSRISSLAILNDSSCDQTLLAVSSFDYPIIYIYNKSYVNISLLIYHKMGITCMKSLNKMLFSGSLDLTAIFWNLNKGVPDLLCDTRNQKITVIDPAYYNGEYFLFTGGNDKTVQCFCITEKKAIFEFVLNKEFVPNKIGFVSDNEKESHAKLMIVSKNTNINKYQIQFFEF